jgi:uroporphyrinogen decarboxylase
MNDSSPDFRRVIAALEHREADQVPLAEVAIDYRIMSQFIGRTVADDDVAAQAEFWRQAGYDYVVLTAGLMRPGGVTRDSQISIVIDAALTDNAGRAVDDQAWNVWARARIHTEQDLEAFPWAAAANLDYRKFHAVQPFLPEGMKIVAAGGKIFTLSWMLMGFEDFAANVLLQPRLVKRLIERVARIQIDSLRDIARIPNVAAVWAVDDLAFGSGPILSPATFREFIFPWYEEFGRVCREHRLRFIFHTDGVIWDLVDDLIHCGVEALHPIDPTCLEIGEVKRRLGDRLCLIGNVPNRLLADGSPEEIEDLTRHLLKTIAPGGGYMLGSGNSVPDWARIENYRRMIETTRRYGRYPISSAARASRPLQHRAQAQ